jgi:hypothetical protein
MKIWNRKLATACWAAIAAFFISCGPAHADFEFTDIACETSTTSGTGTINLAGALTGGYLGFLAAGIDSGDTVPYHIKEGSQLETGIGTFTDGTPDTLSRTAAWSTDGVGAELTLSGGTATVCIGPITSIFTGGVASFNLLALTTASLLGVASIDGTTESTIEAALDTLANLTSIQGRTVTLADAGANSFFGWDDGAGAYENLSAAEAATILGNEVKQPGTETIWIPANAIGPMTATFGQCAYSAIQIANNVGFATCDYNDGAFDVGMFQIRMPKNWNEGSITYKVYWTAASGSGGVTWILECAAYSNDDAIGNANYGSAQLVSDTLTAVNDLDISPTSSALTCDNTPAVDDVLSFRFYRDYTNGSDTLAADAKLVGVLINYTSDAANDD